jgi:hypothetical protein
MPHEGSSLKFSGNFNDDIINFQAFSYLPCLTRGSAHLFIDLTELQDGLKPYAQLIHEMAATHVRVLNYPIHDVGQLTWDHLPVNAVGDGELRPRGDKTQILNILKIAIG